MTGASKILTVSYGTFSCTLEGFDDPFNTMKAIAEYFRDLAAEDRYFGAEPPTPDAAMLHRIAEREIQRRVEAKIQDNGVILRAGDAAEAATEAAEPVVPRPALLDTPAPAAEAGLELGAETAAESVAARLQRIRARHAQAAPEAAAPALLATGLAQSRDQGRAQGVATPPLAPAAAPDDSYIEDQHAEELTLPPETLARAQETRDAAPEAMIAAFDQGELADTPAPQPPAPQTASPEEATPDIADIADFADAAFDVPEALMPTAEAAPEAPLADQVIDTTDQDLPQDAEIDFAMLAGLGAQAPEAAKADPAPVAAQETAADLIEDMPEDQPVAEEDTPEDTPEDADLPEDLTLADAALDDDALLSRLGAAEVAPDLTDAPAPEPTAAPAPQDADASLIASLAALTAAPAAEVSAAPQATEALDDFDTDDALTLEDLPETAAPESAPESTPDLIEPADQPAKAEAEPETLIQAADAAPASPAPASEETAAPRARARVIRIRRQPAPEPAPEAAESLAQNPAPNPAPAAAAAPPAAANAGALSDEAEAALQAELAALEAELGGDAQPEVPSVSAPDTTAEFTDESIAASLAKAIEEPAAPAPAPQAAPAAARQTSVPAEDEAVSRLMAQAASQMGGEETRRRQSAIAHLKAAVAATEADRAATGARATPGEQRMEPYREDLDRVVRPRRPQAEVTTPRPAPQELASRPTPLVLVSAQRIDQPRPPVPGTPAPAAAAAPRVVMPVRPRRPGVDMAAAPPAPLAPTRVLQEADPSDTEAEDLLAAEEAENLFSDANSFQDFADQLGAEALPDLLEAAAVYCAEVLQRPEFSRPLVMRQIAALPGQSQTAREDFLRGFGTLLRQGRITKVKRGMFALTDRSPYLAEARKLAG